MNIVWTQNAMADLTQLVENNQRKILLKIIKLINDIQRNGAEKGLGKPEENCDKLYTNASCKLISVRIMQFALILSAK